MILLLGSNAITGILVFCIIVIPFIIAFFAEDGFDILDKKGKRIKNVYNILLQSIKENKITNHSVRI